jgi:hypothetical protein
MTFAIPQNRRAAGLEVKVDDGMLTICIGVEALVQAISFGLEQQCYIGDDDYKIVDSDLLVDDMVGQLNAEDEIGSTPIHRLLERAAIKAIDAGTEAVSNERRTTETNE